MGYNFKKLAEVEALDSVPENATVLAEVDGTVKRVPGSGLGGAGSAPTIINANFPEVENEDGDWVVSSSEDVYVSDETIEIVEQDIAAGKVPNIQLDVTFHSNNCKAVPVSWGYEGQDLFIRFLASTYYDSYLVKLVPHVQRASCSLVSVY